MRRGSAQARLTEEREGYESEATRKADQILAKLGPKLRQSRDLKGQPPTLRPQRVHSAERAVTPPPCKDTSTEMKQEKSKETE